jgi:hypothetical protein
MLKPTPTAQARFLSKLMEGPFCLKLNSHCQLWQGSRNKAGNCYFSISNKTLQAHRFAYELANGPIPDAMDCLHACGEKTCMNPAHMVLVERPKKKRKRQQNNTRSIGKKHRKY